MTSSFRPNSAATGQAPIRVAILSKRYMPLDEQLTRVLETQLAAYGFQVFTDRHLSIGVEWARQLEQQLRSVDAVIPLISPGSAHSEMLAYEVELAHEASQKSNGRPKVFPVRVNFIGPFPELLARILEPIPAKNW